MTGVRRLGGLTRREALMLTAGFGMAPLRGARAQQKAMPVIGWLSSRSPNESAALVAAFGKGLAQSGYVEGQNVAIEYRWAEGRYDRLAGLAAHLVGRGVDLIVTSGGTPSALKAKAATATIPIVFSVGGDPVEAKLVASLAHPGGNLTGTTSLLVELNPKRVDLLSALVPQAKTIALLVNPTSSEAEPSIQSTQGAAGAKGVQLAVLKAGSVTEIDAAFAMLGQLGAGALVIGNDPFFEGRREQLVRLAARNAIPTMYFEREFAAAGGLISYGATFSDNALQQGIYAGKILKGAKPADLPVLQPTHFDLVVNLTTAKALGLAVPQLLLAQADDVIE